jgi:hypothetical protein
MTMMLGMFSACGQDAGTGAAADPSAGATQLAQLGAEALAAIDACSLLTGDEVRAILGQDAVGEEGTEAGFDLACHWYAEAQPDEERAFGRKEVSVEVGRLEPEAVLREAYNTFKESMAVREEVGGVGAEAFLAQYILPGSSALVMRTNNLLVFLNTSEPDQEAMLKQLGPTVLNRLR